MTVILMEYFIFVGKAIPDWSGNLLPNEPGFEMRELDTQILTIWILIFFSVIHFVD